ncbi:hypothetical protein LTR66_005361 [Elasticomyces elasticus]|nr:hypothetical protein LTR50_005219 [Elasticomyces elasticus]KAK4994659.1 hypothetical protein LTR66_005361 [Elasticomyces elasticus]
MNPFHKSSKPPSENPFHRQRPEEDYEPPPGPPPGHQQEKFEPPAGPPPGYRSDQSISEPTPPPGPPPSRSKQGVEAEPPPYDPWLAVPDSALLPPPPSLGHEASPTANASENEAVQAHQWCAHNPLYAPRPLVPQVEEAAREGRVALVVPPGFAAKGTLKQKDPNAGISYHHDPRRQGRTKVIYFEIRILRLGSSSAFGPSEAECGIAVGFVAPPYPSWRLPGWERGSLGVHGDDGRRYINDSYGGIDFTTAFKENETVGIGMVFSRPAFQGGHLGVEVFFTRNGKKDGGWNLFEENDAERMGPGGVEGLQGECDLFPAVGCFGPVEFEVHFKPEAWLFTPM